MESFESNFRVEIWGLRDGSTSRCSPARRASIHGQKWQLVMNRDASWRHGFKAFQTRSLLACLWLANRIHE